jgi:CRISPR-associated protein (TIGR02584 family)
MTISTKPKTILLCVAGMTPQIVTETLWALWHEQQQPVDEIRVITTLAGRDRIKQELLDPARGRFAAFCRDFGIDPQRITFNEKTIALLQLPDGSQLEDIRTAADNEHAANHICQIVRELTKDPNVRLHASVAGGRKTMSIYLTAAMQLFGRVHDSLSHVLVSEEFETLRDFYYKPPLPTELEVKDRQTGQTRRLSTAHAQIHLADIPFIRLRGVLSHWIVEEGRTYSDFVRRAQDDLDLLEATHDLRLNLRDRTVSVADRRVKLAEREFFLYLLFAYLRQKGGDQEGFVAVEELSRDDLDAVFRLLTAARETELGLEECTSYPRFEFLERMVARLESVNSLDREDQRQTFSETRSKINRKLETKFPERYLLAARGERGALLYGLAVPADRITWADKPERKQR